MSQVRAVRRVYKLRAYPTPPQEAWRMRNLSVTYGDQSAQLKAIRAADAGRWAYATFQAVGRVNLRQHRAGPNRSILDAGWGQFTSILVAKAEGAGRRVILVHPAATSIDCHACGARCTRSRQDTVVCPVHGDLDADLSGARNIAARAGLGSGQASAA